MRKLRDLSPAELESHPIEDGITSPNSSANVDYFG